MSVAKLTVSTHGIRYYISTHEIGRLMFIAIANIFRSLAE